MKPIFCTTVSRSKLKNRIEPHFVCLANSAAWIPFYSAAGRQKDDFMSAKAKISFLSVFLLISVLAFASCADKKDYILLKSDSVSVTEPYALPETGSGTAVTETDKITDKITEENDFAASESYGETGNHTVPDSTQETADTEVPYTVSEEETASTPDSSERENICVISLTDEVKRGGKAKLVISGLPNTEYTIKVYYSTTVSTAKGLEAKFSDEKGTVEWEWRVGSRTKPGSHKIVISGGGSTLTVLFTTLE